MHSRTRQLLKHRFNELVDTKLCEKHYILLFYLAFNKQTAKVSNRAILPRYGTHTRFLILLTDLSTGRQDIYATSHQPEHHCCYSDQGDKLPSTGTNRFQR
jgi:hypothetical protein